MRFLRRYVPLNDARADALLIGAREGAKGSLPSVSWLVHGWDEAEWVVGCGGKKFHVELFTAQRILGEHLCQQVKPLVYATPDLLLMVECAKVFAVPR